LEHAPRAIFSKSLLKQKSLVIFEKAASAEAAVPEKYTYKESQLHSFLCYFVDQRFSGLSKTIRHATSGKGEFGEWVHPDMIGVHYPMEDWRTEVVDLSATIGALAVKLYLFEVKKRLSFSNLREAFFQAVSNSSWANEGYLVAADISTDEDFLRRQPLRFAIPSPPSG
jgi:hypothetical protein